MQESNKDVLMSSDAAAHTPAVAAAPATGASGDADRTQSGAGAGPSGAGRASSQDTTAAAGAGQQRRGQRIGRARGTPAAVASASTAAPAGRVGRANRVDPDEDMGGGDADSDGDDDSGGGDDDSVVSGGPPQEPDPLYDEDAGKAAGTSRCGRTLHHGHRSTLGGCIAAGSVSPQSPCRLWLAAACLAPRHAFAHVAGHSSFCPFLNTQTYGVLTPCAHVFTSRLTDDADAAWAERQRGGRVSDAVLSCPGCFTMLCLDCQKHDKYHNQYRAMFVVNCQVRRAISCRLV